MILRDLVDHPGLGLSLLCGEHALDRPVVSVFTTDLLDPRRYLADRPLVLTGLMWRRDPADSDTFVRALAAADVVALAAGEAAFGTVPADVVEACRRQGVALLGVPVEVSFGQISDLVSSHHDAERERQLTAALGRQRRLLAAIAEGRSLDELLTLAGHDVGVTCRVLTPTGRHVAAPAGPLDAADVDRVCRTFLLADRLPTTVALADGSVASVVAVDSRLGQPLTSWMLICDGDHDHWPDDTHAAVRELATLVALERHQWDENRRSGQRIADEVIALVAAGRATRAELAVRIADLGAEPDGPCLVAAASRPGDPNLLDVTRAVLHDAALQVTDHPVTGLRDDRAVTILTATSAKESEVLRSAFHRLAPAVGRGGLAVGLSAEVAPEALSGALDEALHAVRLAELRNESVAVVTGDEVRSHVLLLGAVPDNVRRAFATRVLGEVLAYDTRRSGDLLPTLDAFLRGDGSWSRCAEALHLHVNTVRYRIGRVEQLTGRDLSRLEDRVDLFLALRSLHDAGA